MSDRDWEEDYPHENGMYTNTCCKCGELFGGHKRRVTCKLCEAGGQAMISRFAQKGVSRIAVKCGLPSEEAHEAGKIFQQAIDEATGKLKAENERLKEEDRIVFAQAYNYLIAPKIDSVRERMCVMDRRDLVELLGEAIKERKAQTGEEE